MKSVLVDNPYFGPACSFSAATLNELPPTLTGMDTQVAFAAMFPYLQPGISVLDVGCGPVNDIPFAVLDMGCEYTGLDGEDGYLIDLEMEILDTRPDAKYEVYRYDIIDELCEISDNSHDVVLLKCVLMHLPEKHWAEVIQQLYRIACKAVFIQDMSWSRLGNATHDKLFRDYKLASAKLFLSHGKEPYMDVRMPAVITKALPKTPMEIFRIDDRPEGDHRESLLAKSAGALQCLWGCYDGKEYDFISKAITNMRDYLEGDHVSFVPPACVVAHIPKAL